MAVAAVMRVESVLILAATDTRPNDAEKSEPTDWGSHPLMRRDPCHDIGVSNFTPCQYLAANLGIPEHALVDHCEDQPKWLVWISQTLIALDNLS